MKRLIPVALLTALLAGCAHDSGDAANLLI